MSENIFMEICEDHKLVETLINAIMHLLLEMGFYSENVNKNVSSLHDTTHGIYALYCDYFITKDKKFKNKIDAIYNYLSVPTKVILADSDNSWINEFVD